MDRPRLKSVSGQVTVAANFPERHESVVRQPAAPWPPLRHGCADPGSCAPDALSDGDAADGSLHSTPPGIPGRIQSRRICQPRSTENLVVLANTVGISLVKDDPVLGAGNSALLDHRPHRHARPRACWKCL